MQMPMPMPMHDRVMLRADRRRAAMRSASREI